MHAECWPVCVRARFGLCVRARVDMARPVGRAGHDADRVPRAAVAEEVRRQHLHPDGPFAQSKASADTRWGSGRHCADATVHLETVRLATAMVAEVSLATGAPGYLATQVYRKRRARRDPNAPSSNTVGLVTSACGKRYAHKPPPKKNRSRHLHIGARRIKSGPGHRGRRSRREMLLAFFNFYPAVAKGPGQADRHRRLKIWPRGRR